MFLALWFGFYVFSLGWFLLSPLLKGRNSYSNALQSDAPVSTRLLNKLNQSQHRVWSIRNKTTDNVNVYCSKVAIFMWHVLHDQQINLGVDFSLQLDSFESKWIPLREKHKPLSRAFQLKLNLQMQPRLTHSAGISLVRTTGGYKTFLSLRVLPDGFVVRLKISFPRLFICSTKWCPKVTERGERAGTSRTCV